MPPELTSQQTTNRLASALSRDTFIQTGLVITLISAVAGGMWWGSKLTTTVASVVAIVDRLSHRVEDAWSKSDQRIHEMQIAADIQQMERNYTEQERRLDIVELWIAKREGALGITPPNGERK